MPLYRRSVQYWQQPERVLAEVYRVLKPGGVVIITFSNRLFYNKVCAHAAMLHRVRSRWLTMDHIEACHAGWWCPSCPRHAQLHGWLCQDPVCM